MRQSRGVGWVRGKAGRSSPWAGRCVARTCCWKPVGSAWKALDVPVLASGKQTHTTSLETPAAAPERASRPRPLSWPCDREAQPTQATRQHLLQSCLAVWGHGPGDSDFSPPCSTHWGHTEAPRACHSPLGSPSPATSGSTRPRTSGPLPLLFPLPVHCSLEAPALHSLPRLHVSARAPLSEWTSLITPLNTAAPPPHIPLAPLMCVYP